MESRSQKNAALVREFLIDVIAGGDTDALDIFLTDDAVQHQPALDVETGSPAGDPTWWQVLAATDIDIRICDVVAAGDTVAVRGTVTGTHQESLLDLTPTGASFQIASVWFCRIDGGRIADIWSLHDALGLLQQLGANLEASGTRSATGPSEPR